ncbi:hypothetical protein [Dysgonomonas macrotermitis]|uniref:Uncharacterized protein n=1 Tax=Dysgonomonas macrotermitis TaxID=1346286 RepID=A0A1M5CIJ6_9BACT|nr:hypothetical protein [Dysgonomonas macrotermitis]SHF54595.1 hypothetical protein SAMN05444362_107184 [Dysgonomonas macrotermitis]
MNRKYTTLLISIAVFLMAYSQSVSAVNFDYEQFKTYFGNISSGSSHELELPYNEFTKDLFHSPTEKIYAVNWIQNYCGNDLFVIHRIDEIQNADYVSIVPFKDSKPLYNDLQEIIIENAPESDKGIFNQYFTFENNTIVTDIFWSERKYEIPVAVKAEVKFEIDSLGKPFAIKVDTCLFSSRYFDTDELLTLPAVKAGYPVKSDPYVLTIANWTQAVSPFISSGIQLLFYLEQFDNKLITVLETRNGKEEIIDTYRIGESSGRGKEHASKIEHIAIKTSGGNIHLTSDGYFIGY